VQLEQEGVFGQQSYEVFRKFLAGVGGGCSEREVHGEYPLIIMHRFRFSCCLGLRPAFRGSYYRSRDFGGCFGRQCVLLYSCWVFGRLLCLSGEVVRAFRCVESVGIISRLGSVVLVWRVYSVAG
jgi:hypothetical protein